MQSKNMVISVKNCPFCKAQIDDNARFCIYCMSPLEDKQKVTPKKSKKRYIALSAAALIVIIAAAVLFAFMPKNQSNNDVAKISGSAAQTTASDMADITSTTQSASNNDVTVATEIVTDSAGGKIIVNAENGKPLSTDLGENIPSNPQDSGSAPSQNVIATSKAQSKTAAKSTSAAASTAKITTKAQPTAADNVTYTYRAAKYGDDYSVSYPTDNCVVITGISSKSSSGTYTIPETLGGKKVIAVMCGAFCGDNICDTVKKVIVPATVKTIWGGAFSLCRNMTDIYFCGSSIYTDIAAFADESIRKGSLTIHCSYNCSDRNLRYYRNTAEDYGALFDEWNG